MRPVPNLLASFSLRGIAFFLLAVVALSAWSWSGTLLAGKTLDFGEQMEYFLSLAKRNLLNYLPMFVLVTIADRLPLKGARRNVALGVALVGGALLAVQLRCLVMPAQQWWVYGSQYIPYCSSFPTWRTYVDAPASYLTPLALGTMAMVFVLGRRRDQELVAAVQKARTERLASHRRRIESDIEAMQARVDPDVLFATLARIRTSYDTDATEGESLLDELIQNLRDAARRPIPEPQAS